MVYNPDEKLIKGNLTITGDGSGTLDLKELEIKGDLIVDLPNATIKNQAKVGGYVRIDDISENTWIELVDNNKLIFASENDTLIIPDNISPKSVELKTKLTVVTSKEITVKAKKDIKILVKASEEDEGVEIKVKTDKDYECVTLYNKVTQDDINKEIKSRKEVRGLIDKIESLDNISLEDAEKVASIRAEYDGLEEDKKVLIPNLWKLEDAEARIEQLKAEKAEEERQAKVVEKALGEINSAESLKALEAIGIDENLSEANKAKLKTAIEAKRVDLEESKTIEDGIKEDYDKDKEAIDEQEDTVVDYYIAQNIVDQIAELKEVSLDSKGAVELARTGYESLTDKQKTFVTNLEVLKAAEAKIQELEAEQAEEERQDEIVAETKKYIEEAESLKSLEAIKIDESLSEANKAKLEEAKKVRKVELENAKAEADEKAAEVVVNQIAALKEVTLESKEAVEAAREAYDALTDEQKKLVTNLGTLTAAEAEIERLEAAKVEEERQAKVVEDTLTDINSVESLEDLEEIKIPEDISEANNKILVDAKNKKEVELEAAKLEEDKKAAQLVVDKISALREITLESKDAVETARDVYDDLTEDQKKLVNNIEILTDAEDKLNNLREEALADLKKNIDEFEATVIRLLNQQGRFHLKKVSDNEINFDFITEGNIGFLGLTGTSEKPATKNTSMRNYTGGSGLATVLGQKSGDKNSDLQEKRIGVIKNYIDMDTATIDGESFGGLTSMSKIYNMKVGDFLGTKTGKVKVKSEIAEDLYLEYTINFSLPENK